MKLKRKFLVEVYKDLLTDEYDATEVASMSKKKLILRIIDAAQYYQSNQ